MALFKQTTDFKFEFKNQCCFLCYSLKILLTKQVIIIFKKYKMYPSTKKIFNFQLSVISLFQFFKVLPDAVKSIHVSLNKESCRFGSLTELKNNLPYNLPFNYMQSTQLSYQGQHLWHQMFGWTLDFWIRIPSNEISNPEFWLSAFFMKSKNPNPTIGRPSLLTRGLRSWIDNYPMLPAKFLNQVRNNNTFRLSR